MRFDRHLRLNTPSKGRLPSARWLGVILPLICGLCISFALFQQSRRAARRDLLESIDDRAEKRVELLRTQVMRSMEVLHSIASLQATGDVSAESFLKFVTGALARQPELQALGWAPRVTRAQRIEIERALPPSDRIPTGIVERNNRDEFIPAADRAEYFPVQYIEPVALNDAALGFDLASSPPRRAAMERARATGQPSATAPIQLVQEESGQLGVIVYLPAFADSTRAGVDTTLGFCSAVFRLDHLLSLAKAESDRDGLDIRIVDDDAGKILVESAPVLAADRTPNVIKTLDVAGRSWTATFMPRQPFLAQHKAGNEWIVLGAGVCMTLLLSGYLYGGLLRTAEIERRVVERTLQLSTEVAERTRAEEAARLAEAKYRGIFENSVEGIFQTTPDGHYLSANIALARIYGYASPQELTAVMEDIAVQLYVQARRRDEFARLMREHGAVTHFESQVYRKDGGVIWISESARSVHDERGMLLYYEGVVVDITDRRNADEARRRSHDELEARVRERTAALAAANTAKSRFLASMSHEIRTPMNAILGYAQVLRRDPTLRDAHREAVATIASSGNHLLGLIDEILDLSRIEAGHIEVRLADFDLSTMVADLGRMFRQRCEQKGLALRIEWPADTPAIVHGDEKKLRQVLINLLGNAVRFTDAGEVVMSVRRRKEVPPVYFFEVTDSGIGIPAEAMDEVFQPFQQASSGAGRGGSGLGLAIARQHVRLMGGDLRAESAPGRGSRFHFTLALPTAMGDVESLSLSSTKTIERLAPGHHVRAVIIDDIVENRRVLSAFLTSVGCDVTSYDSGTAAIAELSAPLTNPPDILFVDILMPGLDGIETAGQLREIPSLVSAKFVATSAAAFAHELEQYAASGFHDVITKPIVCERVFECLANLLNVEFDSATAEPLLPADDHLGGAISEAALLSEEWRDRLRRAAEFCGITELRQYADELELLLPPAADLAHCIRACLHQYDTSPILEILGGVPV